jgi:hypothetical protein
MLPGVNKKICSVETSNLILYLAVPLNFITAGPGQPVQGDR